MNSVLCSQCGTPNAAQARFCAQCGTPLPAQSAGGWAGPSACPRCQTPIRSSTRFCPSCGYDLIQQAATPGPAAGPLLVALQLRLVEHQAGRMQGQPPPRPGGVR